MAIHTPVPAAARTSSGNSGIISIPQAARVAAYLDVTAASGSSPTLDVEIQESLDGGNTWWTRKAFAQKTAAGKEIIEISGPTSGHLRVAWTVGGSSPSFTFSVQIRTY